MLVAASTHVTARSWQALEPQQAKTGRFSKNSRAQPNWPEHFIDEAGRGVSGVGGMKDEGTYRDHR